jgi:flavodoxin
MYREEVRVKRILVVYYSRTGITKEVMEHLAQQIGGDVEELIDKKDRSGILGWIMAGKDAAMKNKTTISTIKYKPEQYDIVVIGTPTWASTMSSAIRTYIEQNRSKFKKVAFVATQGGGGNGKIFDDMAELCGRSAATTCQISGKEVKNKAWHSKIEDFSKKLG